MTISARYWTIIRDFKGSVAKRFSKIVLLHSLWAGRKIVQIGQTEAKSLGFLRTRRCTKVLREAKFVQNAKHIIPKFVLQTNFYL